MTKLLMQFLSNGIEVVLRRKETFGTGESGVHTIGIHSIIEDNRDLENVLEQAIKDNFPRVFLYL